MSPDDRENQERPNPKEEAAHGNDIEAMSIDGAGFNGPVLRTARIPLRRTTSRTPALEALETSTYLGAASGGPSKAAN